MGPCMSSVSGACIRSKHHERYISESREGPEVLYTSANMYLIRAEGSGMGSKGHRNQVVL